MEQTNPLGVSSRSFLQAASGLLYVADANRHEWGVVHQWENFRVGTRDAIFPRVNLADDVTTWQQGMVLYFIKASSRCVNQYLDLS